VVPFEKGMTVREAIAAIENDAGWVFAPAQRKFYHAAASHSVDIPDAFGRPTAETIADRVTRPVVQVSFLFRRLSGSATNDEITAGFVITSFSASIPDGVRGAWSSTTERSFYDEVTDVRTGNVVESGRKTVSAGLQLDALAARLPGGYARIDGTLSVSAFVGRSADKSEISIPLQLDAVRFEWHRVCVIRGADISAALALRHFGFEFSSGADAVEVLVRVE